MRTVGDFIEREAGQRALALRKTPKINAQMPSGMPKP